MSAVSVKVFHAVVAGAAAQGVDPAVLLAAAGIDPEDLADPDGRLPPTAEARLWHEAVRLTGDDGFGLHLSERLQIDTLGPLGFAVRSSATLGEAYARVRRYMHLIVRGLLLEIVPDGDLARIRHEPPRGQPPPARHAVEFLMANLVLIARRGIGESFVPRAVRFRHAAPAQVDEHRRLLGPGVRFGAPHDELVMERAALDAPQLQAEAALAEVLDQHLGACLAALPPDGGFLDRVRGALVAELSHGEPALAAVAGRLGMSPRSLQRRLQEERSSLSALLDALRADLAVRYLSDSRESIAEVAFRLGFSEVSTFHRAFKRWTGLTPAAYRRERRGAAQTVNSLS
jgi:AraC-like DNA-binding protein